MWGSLLERTAAALERTGDVLTERATAHVKKQHTEQGAGAEGDERTTGTENGSSGSTDRDSKAEQSESKEQGGEAWGSHATIVAIPPPKPDTSSSSSQQQQQASVGSMLKDSIAGFDKKKQSEVLGSLQKGWGSVVEATQRAVEATKEAAEKEKIRIQSGRGLFGKGPYRRDPSLPLDVAALRDAEVVYITDRLITTSHPAMQSSTDGDVTPERKLAAVGQLLEKRHGGKYMVWNLSEVEYDYSVLDDQVLVYQFPGSPSPPLGLLLKLLLSIESWLKADERNVAVLHCLTGRGRTSTVLAAFLCWTGEAGFHDPIQALEYIAYCKRCDVETLTIPSQRRYASYFANMLDGVRPSQPPLLLKRIIMSEAPKFGKRPPSLGGDDTTEQSPKEAQLGCAPYLQLFKSGSLIFTTAAAMSYSQTKEDLPFCVQSDGPISFPIETIVQGDILIRCRHLTRKGQRVSMFRAAFHTGYVPPKVLRLKKVELDGACTDRRFPDDFFLDLIFEKCEAGTASKHLLTGPSEEQQQQDAEAGKVVRNEADARREKGTVAPGKAVTASQYDSMLHRDSRFWDVIAARREENAKRMAEASKSKEKDGTEGGTEVGSDGGVALAGPTIGRRRDFASMKSGKKGGDSKDGAEKKGTKPAGKPPRNAIESFSIGGEFDFMPDDEAGESAAVAETGGTGAEDAAAAAPPKRDELMEALMALDDLTDSPVPVKRTMKAPVVEEIVFGGDSEEAAEGEGGEGQATTPTNLSAPMAAAAGSGGSSLEGDGTVEKADEGTTAAAAPAAAAVAPSVGEAAKDETAGGVVEDISNAGPIGSDEPTSTTPKPADSGEAMEALAAAEDDDDALLAAAAGATAVLEGADDRDDVAYEELDFDDDDDELEDLENFLTKASGK